MQDIMDPSRTWKQEGSALASINLGVPLVDHGGGLGEGTDDEGDAMTRTKAISTKIRPVRVEAAPVSIRR